MNDDLVTFDIVKKLIVEHFGVKEENVTESMTFDDLGADSLDVVELVMEIEDSFNIQFDDERIESLSNIGDAINYIEELKRE